jgi:hypothetical protein
MISAAVATTTSITPAPANPASERVEKRGFENGLDTRILLK